MSATGGGQTATELFLLDNRTACIIGKTALSRIIKGGETDTLATQAGPSKTRSEDSKLTPQRIRPGGITSSGTDPQNGSGTESTCTAQRIRNR
ncbi:hypothetical protein DPX16_0637 [Anabarilius grahami]|uniref:Uncharacterized protein n=1 Tax=Anabarilius grahami TaxID=495550 RepID=A0A3N0Y0J2_ANAGA|nr:hypothetical protein DPX16_0637 [Anabarilius grahami]